ncbi:ABC transporter substrate-binding protein [Allorhodopirellula solitaria]|uniref:D-allose-binding periplasmic protein n=1 Tax=Allorhodopirellula solitaria TaxID=2527987 RepID=A0A5C5YK21_9BACT|nr:substrate-binding domain-containing protein [Allorhodopirellula solitaria]TWT75256.1 D-allose-binding periplasmic protein precursor [Allorhodopirellula solitaria]
MVLVNFPKLSLGIHSLALLLLVCGCRPPQAETTPTTAEQGELHFAVIPKGENHIFWQSIRSGAEQAGEETGVRITFKGPSKESDRSAQISVFESFLNSGVDGICLAPLDADALVRPVEEAGRAGVPVVIMDSGLNADAADFVSYVATDNFRGGQMAADAMADSLGDDGGKVICLRYQQGSESTHQREQGFLEGIAKYPNIEVISSDQYAGTTTESAVDKSQSLLNRFGDEVDGVFTTCEPNAEGMLRAIRDRDLAGKVKLIAFDSSDSLREGMKVGHVSAIVLQDPVRIGYLAVKTLAASIRGEQVEPFVDTGIFVATSENQDEENIARLLDPPRT